VGEPKKNGNGKEIIVGINQKELDLMIKDVQITLEKQFRANGCGTEVGCMAGKAHFRMHEDKLASDINDFKNFKKDTEFEGKTVAKKITEASIMLHDVLARMVSLFDTVKFIDEKANRNADDLKSLEAKTEKNISAVAEDAGERIKEFDVRLWGVFAAMFLMCIATIWAAYTSAKTANEVNASVSKINSVDINNQASTETYMALLVEQLSGKPISEVVKEHERNRIMIEKTKGVKKQ
jgi:hypothetical protein